MSRSTFVKVSTQITEHPKMLRVPRAHRWVYIEVLCYCARNLTDGFIPAEYVRRNCDDDELLSLIDAGFIHHAPGGYLIHDYLDWQTSRGEIEAKREAKREAGRIGGKRSGEARRSKTEAPASRLVEAKPNIEVEVEVEEQELLLNGTPSSDTFPEFWTAYPRKVGKRKAEAEYRRAVKRASAAVILAGALRYANDPNREPEFTAHPSTWLHRDGWGDEQLPPREKPPPERPTPIPPTFDAAALRPADPIPMPDNIRQFKGASA